MFFIVSRNAKIQDGNAKYEQIIIVIVYLLLFK
jgi:hypothetical protein